ncbi:MAG TPA: carboxypeptidase-like regulatory domain-containing protein [Dactylosporangium sp.]|nr:carboxypeptidase-like regulatory domain-containing protein [Dactylosporangium sp.]
MRKHALRRPLLYAALTATAAAIAAVPAGPAAAATGGTITGHLTDAAGNPAANAFVTARAADWSTSSSAMSDASGAYTIAGLPANDYTVSFQPQGEIFTQYLHQKFVPADATHFAVAEGATVVADDQVVRTGTIAGTLLGRDGAPVPARLGVYTAEGYNWVGGKDVAADGSFSVALPPAAYKLEFTIRGTRHQWNGGATNFYNAAPITVAADATVPLQETLLPVGSIAGRLTNADGSPAANVTVLAEAPDWSVSTRSATTDGDGRYRIDDLTAGEYLVGFVGPHGVAQYAHGKLARGSADRFTVSGDQVTTVDEQFLPRATVRVHAHDAQTGAPLSGFCVEDVGSYTVTGCTDGTEVELTELFAGPHVFNVRIDDRFHFAAEVRATVVAGEQTIDAALVRGAMIHVPMVKRADGGPAEGCINVARIGQPFAYGRGGLCSEGGTTPGTATVGPLEPGTYQVLADPSDDALGLQWVGASGGTGDRDAAMQVTVAAGDEITLGTVRFDAAGSIRGKVTDVADGAPLQYTCVWIAAQPPWSTDYGCPAVTGADGTYSLAGLGPYAWPVQFVQRNYQWRWSGNAVNRHEATAVTVRPGRSVAANIKLRSTAGGTLTGAVRDAAGNPVDAGVYAFDAVSGEAVQFGSGTPDGTPYTIALIAPQPVKLWYVLADGRGGWAGGADFASATTYQVRNNKTLMVDITVA